MRRIVHGQKSADEFVNSSLGACRSSVLVHRSDRQLCQTFVFLLVSLLHCTAGMADYRREIRPMLKQYCLGCHSIEKHKGDLDLESFKSLDEILRRPKVWQDVAEKLLLEEMPPKEKPQPTPAERERLIGWV